MHHLGRGNLNGARAQLDKSLSKLEQYPARFCQIDNAQLISDLRAVLETFSPIQIFIQKA
jgi:predicted metal-dependent hydrolase